MFPSPRWAYFAILCSNDRTKREEGDRGTKAIAHQFSILPVSSILPISAVEGFLNFAFNI